eukprot:gb/GEZN01010726.1/.p1 GENE.gb/GEZN01010726.1/~~gb/GEZN01010726.1/.p1  ORF type:complete len:315 (-),score=16.38 gb/GEZN01010726.1/:203-1147(-)
MCRIFGFRSVLQSMVHRSLMLADNALGKQSSLHPDGWGVGYYIAGIPHLVKNGNSALSCSIFSRISGVVASETVMAHVRQASTGANHSLNAHPFQYGRWLFGHNGQINNFDKHKQALLEKVAPRYQRFILGDTDSEVLFYIFLSELSQRVDLHRPGTPFEDIKKSFNKTFTSIQQICDGLLPEEKSILTVLVTDGQSMVGVKLGKPLLWSTHKKKCPDRDICPHLSKVCEAPSKGLVNHMIFSSEELSGDNVWTMMKDGDVVGCDWRMHLHDGKLSCNIPTYPKDIHLTRTPQMRSKQAETLAPHPLASASAPT